MEKNNTHGKDESLTGSDKGQDDEELREFKEIEKMSKPFWLAKLFVRFPWIVLLVSWVVLFAFVGITGVFGLF